MIFTKNNLSLCLTVAVGVLITQGCTNPVDKAHKFSNDNDVPTQLKVKSSGDTSNSNQSNTKSLGAYSLRQDDSLLLDSINKAIDAYVENTIMYPELEYGYEDVAVDYAAQIDATVEVATPTSADQAGSAESNYSQTNLIEQGVDEADFVKQNQDYIFLYGNEDDNKAIRIYKKSDFKVNQDITSQPAPLSMINIYPDTKVEGLFLDNDKLHTLNLYNSPQFNHYFGYAEYPNHQNGFVEIDSYDVSKDHITAPKLIASIKLNGNYNQSRKIDDDIFVVMQNGIELNDTIVCDNHLSYAERMQKWQDDLEASIAQCQQKYRITEQELIQRMPKDVNGDAINPNDCYLPNYTDIDAPQLYSLTSLTLINTIDLQDNKHKTTCVVGNANDFYMSDKAMYLAQGEYEQPNQDNWLTRGIAKMLDGDYNDYLAAYTIVHKFALNGDQVEYKGSGRVDGHINYDVPSFSMNEYNDVLRIVTSSDSNDGVENMLYTLKESDDTLELKTLALLPNANNPKPIGKPFERIKGVRFMGDQGYVVTFLNADPLYKIDLSDPTSPMMMGELDMPGYSAYLHKLSDDYLMGIGYTVNERAQPTGIQTTLFDVTGVPKIVSQDTVAIKDGDFQPNFQLMIDTDSKALSTIVDEGVFKVTIPYIQELQQQGSQKQESQNRFSTQTKALEYEIDLKTAEFNNRYRRDGQILSLGFSEQPRFRALIDGNNLYYSTNDGRINKYIWGQP